MNYFGNFVLLIVIMIMTIASRGHYPKYLTRTWPPIQVSIIWYWVEGFSCYQPHFFSLQILISRRRPRSISWARIIFLQRPRALPPIMINIEVMQKMMIMTVPQFWNLRAQYDRGRLWGSWDVSRKYFLILELIMIIFLKMIRTVTWLTSL